MSDIFISYSSADRERAALMARALEQRGWSVWWDRTIPPGRQFDEVIEEALDATRCVVVLWSKASAASSWVKTEAAEAMRRKALIPALIDPEVRIPLEFRRLQAADLTAWRGELSTPEFEQFCAAIAANVVPGQAPGPPPPLPRPAPPAPVPPRSPSPSPSPQPAAPPKSGRRTWITASTVVGVLVVIGLGLSESETPTLGPVDPQPTPIPAPTASAGPTDNRAAPLSMSLSWRDYVLLYSGHIEWDGTSPTARLAFEVADGNTRQSLGSRQLGATVNPIGQGRWVFSTHVPVPGDSRTAGPHTHDVNLVFQSGAPGAWTFLQNCMTPNQCY